MQCVAVCCSVLQCVAVCRTAQSQTFYLTSFTTTHCNTLQHAAKHRTTLQHTATHCNTLQHTAAHCNTLQHTATRCNTMQHKETHCNINRSPAHSETCYLPSITATMIQSVVQLQYVVGCCSVLRCVAVRCTMLQRDAV